MKKLLCSALLALACSSLVAQTKDEWMARSWKEPELQLFNQCMVRTFDRLEDLYRNIRGVSFECNLRDGEDGFFANVQEYIKGYGSVADKIGFIYYSVEEEGLNIWLVYKGGYLHVSDTTDPQTLIDLEHQIRSGLGITQKVRGKLQRAAGTEEEEIKPDKAVYEEAVGRLSTLLLPAKFRKKLKSLEHLEIFGEWNIGQIPFYLLKPDPEKDRLLIDDLSLNILPNLCGYREFQEKHQAMVGMKNELLPKSALVVGNPAFSQLPPLPYAEMEARKVAEMLNASLITGNAATVDSVMKLAPAAELLYLATHGYFDFDSMMTGSFIALAPSIRFPAGKWVSKQIQTMPLEQTRLAILSACQTGFGKSFEGGFVGIGRAFNKAGVDEVVASLWNVDDEVTAKLMLTFLEELQQPSEFFPSAQMRNAMLKIRKEHPDPSLWAPFVVFGFSY